MMDELTYSLTYQDVVEILRIIDETANCREVSLELGDLKLTVVKAENQALPATDTAVSGSGQSSSLTEVLHKGEIPAKDVLPGKTGATLGESSSVSATSTAGTENVGASGFELKSPLMGIFYRAPAPGDPPFVEVGSKVKEDDVVAIIDVMKMMNMIKAGYRGVVREIRVGNEEMVQYGQVLMVIDSSDE